VTIKIISFDVDGTLVDLGFADRVWNYGMPELYSEKTGIDIEVAREMLRKRYEAIGDEDLRWYMPRYWFNDLGLDGDPREFILRFKDDVKIYPEVPGVLSRLSKRYVLVATSNAASRSRTSKAISRPYSRPRQTLTRSKRPRAFTSVCAIS